MNKQQTFKPDLQFVRNRKVPKSLQGKPSVSRNRTKTKNGKSMLKKAMKKFAK